MSKAGTMYSEQERLIKLQNLAAFGVNPHAAFLVFESYAEKVSPLPVKFVWEAQGKDLMDNAARSVGRVELYIMTAGYVGKRMGRVEKLDLLAVKILCMSYYTQQRPLPLSFQMANAVEFHLRTPGISDSDSKNKNPLRIIMPELK